MGTDHGMVNGGRGIRFWAFVVSVGLHAAVLAGFAAARFSQSAAEAGERAVPVAAVSQAVSFAEAAPILPKPQVAYESAAVAEGRDVLAEEQDVLVIGRNGDEGRGEDEGMVTSHAVFALEDGEIAGGASFFGSRSRGRRICYVVDCSASMMGLLSRVKGELCRSVEELRPDQYFAIVFFGDGRLIEFKGGRFVRADSVSKAEARRFVNTIECRGGTNAMAAVERSLRIRDDMGNCASVIYVLTDGFELAGGDGEGLAHRVATLRRSFAAGTRINTIGFWAGVEDRRVLETIAAESGGTFTAVTDGR